MRIAMSRCALSVALALAGASAHAADWTFKDLTPNTVGFAFGINDAGQVAGYAYFGSWPTAFISGPNGGALTNLGTLSGVLQSFGAGINASGQVAGISYTAGSPINAFVSGPNGGPLTNLGAVPGTITSDIVATGINNAGQVVGFSNNSSVAFISGPGGLRNLGTLSPGFGAAALGINNLGQVTGYASTAAGTRAFISAPNGGALTALGTLGGGLSIGQGINDSGQVVGYSWTTPGSFTSHAFVSAANGGALTDLGTLAGGTFSGANAINNTGQVVGTSGTANGNHAFISVNGGSLVDLNIFAPSGTVLTDANAINKYAQIAGNTSNGHAFLLTLNPRWSAGSGSWDNAANWNFAGLGSLGFTPGAPHDVVIAPAGSATILGSANATVNTLAIGGGPGQIVTFNLNGGNTVATNGTNLGANATLAGNGVLGGNLTVEGGGRVLVADGQSMLLAGRVDNLGKIDVQARTTSASLQVGGLLTNAGGQINLMNADVYAQGGIVNAGRMSLTGLTTVSGVVDNGVQGQVNVSGISAHAIFWDNFRNNGTVTVTTGSTATFFGLVNGAGSFLGGGAKEFAGGYAPGNSPASTTISGPVTFSSAITMELGGLTPGSGHDKITFSGPVTLAGADLNVLWYGGWTGHDGDIYDLFDWDGGLTGTFGQVNMASLDSGLMWDLSMLYTTGEISIHGVTAVPEPETYAMMLAGLGLLGFVARRRKKLVA